MPRWSASDQAADRRLLNGLNEGDEDSLAALYDVYAERLYDYCMSMICEAKAATEIVHDTFIDASRRAPRLRDRVRLRAWLYGAARRRCLQRGRARGLGWGGGADWMAEIVEADVGLSPDELREVMEAAMARLDFNDQEALFLTVRHGVLGPDLSAVLGMPPRRAARRVTKARTRAEAAVAAEVRSLARRCAAGRPPARALRASDAEAELVGHAAGVYDSWPHAGRGASSTARPIWRPPAPRPAETSEDQAAAPWPTPNGAADAADSDAEPEPTTDGGTSPAPAPAEQGADTEPGVTLDRAAGAALHKDRDAHSELSYAPDLDAGAASGSVKGAAGGSRATGAQGLELGRGTVPPSGPGADSGDGAALAQHVGHCEACRRRSQISAVPLFALAPAPVLPAGLRHRVMHTATDPELAGHRADIAARGGNLTPEGLPRQPDVPSQLTRRGIFVGGGAAGALATALVAVLVMGSMSADLDWPLLPRPHPSPGGEAQARDGSHGEPSPGQGPGADGRPEPGGPRSSGRPPVPGPYFSPGSPVLPPSDVSSPPPTDAPKGGPTAKGVLSVGPSSVALNGNRQGVITLKASDGPVSWMATPSITELSLSDRSGTLAAGSSTQVAVAMTGRQVITMPGEATVTFTDRVGKRLTVQVKWGVHLL